jgi:hypothetical protein
LIDEYGTLKLCDFGLARKLIDLQGDNDGETGVIIFEKSLIILVQERNTILYGT